MGICSDRAVNYLKTHNLNTVRHPEENIAPLDLIGEFRGARGIIGTLDQLVDGATANMPRVRSGAASEISGQRTSKMPINIGLNILGSILGPLGGNLGVKAAYDNSRKMEFAFLNVERERANQIGIGDYIESGDVRWEHLILEKYLFGRGNLYVITEVVKSDKIGVTAFKRDNASVSLDIPEVQQMVGGDVSVGLESEVTNTLSYKGNKKLVFGFAAIELSAGERGDSGDLNLVFRPVTAGAVSMSADGSGSPPKPMDVEGALGDLKHVDPAALGE